MNTPIGMRCTHVGCDEPGRFQVALVLYADPDHSKDPLFQKVRFPRQRRCEQHKSPLYQSFVTEEAWQKMRAWFAESARSAGRGAVVPVRELTQVIYFESEAEFERIEIWAKREDGELELAGKAKLYKT